MLSNKIRITAIAALTLALSTAVFAQSSGADLYKAKCQMCHGPDGKGNTPGGKMTKALPFDSPDIVKKSDADLLALTKGGKNKMPAYAGKFSDAELKSVVAYIRTLQKK